MARLTPDPTFYPSPAEAAAAPVETHAYVVTLNTGTNGDRAPDALTVIDLQDGSSTYGQLVGRLDMPDVGDELHHFGWNACSSALCPWAPHPHVERRYLLVPGLRSSNIHVVDTKGDAPKLVKTISKDEIASKAGYSRPHTIHCGPDGIYVSALGNPEGDGPGGIFLLDHEDFSVKGAWENDRGPQELAYDFWWHLNYGTRDHVRVGHAEHGRGRPRRRAAAGQPVRPQAARLGPRQAQPRAGDRPRPGAPDGARAATGAQPVEGLRLRRRGHLDRGPVRLGVAVGARRGRHVQRGEGDLDPGRAGRGRAAAAAAAALRRRAAADHRHLAVGRRQGPLRVLLGHGRAQALRRLGPAQRRARPAPCGSAGSSRAPRTRRAGL